MYDRVAVVAIVSGLAVANRLLAIRVRILATAQRSIQGRG
jgi:hypothetical protein